MNCELYNYYIIDRAHRAQRQCWEIDLAEEYNTIIIPHAFKTNILMSATLQYIATLPNVWYQEFCEQDTILRQTLTSPLFSIDPEGYVHIPQTPGIGITLNQDAVERFRVV